MTPIRVMIVEDHQIFRLGLRRACESDTRLQVVGEAGNGQAAVEMVEQVQPDVILMDINMPVMDGIEATRQISAAHPEAGIIMLTVVRDDVHVFEAIKAGARGYLLKDIEEPALLQAIFAVQGGEALVDPEVAVRILEEFRRISRTPNEGPTLERLTEIEMDILLRVAQGENNDAIARELSLSEKTVVNRLTTIYQKLHVNNRTQAALYAIRKGWAKVQVNL